MIMGKLYFDRSARSTRLRLFKSEITSQRCYDLEIAFLQSKISTLSRRHCVVVGKIY